MANEKIAAILQEMAFFGELQSDNPFKIRAWQNSARLLEEQSADTEELVRSGEIGRIQGVGKGTQALVQEFVQTGKVAEHEAMKARFPPRILELTEVRGLGPKKIKALYEQLSIGSLTELEYACEENRLLELKGFGRKTQDSVLANIQKIKANRGKAILPMAIQVADDLEEELARITGVEKIEATGELRRLLPIIGRVEFLLAGKEKEIFAGLERAGFKDSGKCWERNLADQLPVAAYVCGLEEFGARLLETTGPEKFVAGLGKLPAASEEKAVFAARGITFLPPESRDLGLAGSGLVEEKNIKGVFHLHTTWSDGKNSLEEMARAALEMGFEYLGVSEHSQTAFYANGLDRKRVLEQRKEIEKVQEKLPGIRIFQGIESDILTDGSLDFPDEVLKQFDFVIASVHGQMRMPRGEMTKRICRALENPYTTWLGHWTGRLLLGRDGFDFDHDQVLKVAAREGKSIELNSNPYRLDMSWEEVPRAAELGIPIGIFPDAHSAGGLKDVRFGVWMARKAGLTAAQVVNTKSRKEMEQWLSERRPH